MENKKKLAAPCGLYCGVCAILIAHRDNNTKFKEKLTTVYGVGVEDIQCEGCLSDKLFKYCRTCQLGLVRPRKRSRDVINAMIFLVCLLKIFHFLSVRK